MECAGLPEISFADLESRLYGDGRRLPIAGVLELTERCNLRCIHCYVRQQAGDRERRERELGYEQWARILDELTEAGCLQLLLTGGEVLLHPDFAEIYLYAKRRGILVSVFTNGTLLSPEIVELFHEWPPQILSLTLYGASEETYERMTGSPGSYQRFQRGIQLLHEQGVPFLLKAMLTTVNGHEYEAMREIAEGFGLRLRHDAIIWPRMDAEEETRHLRLPPERVVEIDFSNPDSMRMWWEANQSALAAPESDTVYRCGAGLRGFYIDPYGRLGLCVMSRATEYSVVEGSFAEGWNEHLRPLRYQKSTRDFECLHCKIAALCVRCPALAQWENGDPETPVAYVCQVAHERARAFGLEGYDQL